MIANAGQLVAIGLKSPAFPTGNGRLGHAGDGGKLRLLDFQDRFSDVDNGKHMRI